MQLPHIGKQGESTVRSSAEKLPACDNVLTIAETGCMSYALTEIINPNIPQILVKRHASPDFARSGNSHRYSDCMQTDMHICHILTSHTKPNIPFLDDCNIAY
jgi:hypothetical protein